MKPIIKKLNWKLIGDLLFNRINRLRKINNCQIIYIGRSKNLKRRYREFTGSHTIMYCVWMLLYFGWDLEYGWLVSEKPTVLEKELLEKYKQALNSKK